MSIKLIQLGISNNYYNLCINFIASIYRDMI